MNHFYPHSGEHLFYRKTVFKTKGNGIRPPFRVLNCTNNSLRNTKIQYHLTVCRCCVGAIDILNSNLTCSRRSDISRKYGAKRRGEKTKQNKTNKKRKKEKKRREKRNSPTSTPADFFPTHFSSR